MGKTCAVPKCTTGSYASRSQRKKLGFPQLSIFQIPSSIEIRRRWQAILKTELRSTAVVCEKHFDEEDIVKYDEVRLPDGTIHSMLRERRKLRENAVPSKLLGLGKTTATRKKQQQKFVVLVTDADNTDTRTITNDNSGMLVYDQEEPSVKEHESCTMVTQPLSNSVSQEPSRVECAKQQLKTASFPEAWGMLLDEK